MDNKKSFISKTNRNSHPFPLASNSLIYNSNPSIPTAITLNDDNNNFMRMSNKFNIYDNLNNENNRESPHVLYKITKKKERYHIPKNFNYEGNYISDGGLNNKSKKFNDSRNFVKAGKNVNNNENNKNNEINNLKNNNKNNNF